MAGECANRPYQRGATGRIVERMAPPSTSASGRGLHCGDVRATVGQQSDVTEQVGVMGRRTDEGGRP